MLNQYLINCKYRVGSLKRFIYLIPSSSTINYTVDNGEAVVMSVNGLVNKLKCGNVQLTSEESMDGRFKFNNKVIIKLFENQTSGLIEILNNLIKNNYKVVVEDLEGTQFICNVEFPSFVTYDYNFASNAISPNTATVTFATDSNFPTLEIQQKITEANIMGNYSCAYNTGAIKTLKLCNIKNTYIVRDNATFEGVYATGAYDDSPYKTINFLKNSFNFTENYDGQKYTHTLSFTIPLSDYKSYWQYNLIEFTQNKYVALFDTVNGTTIASGYNNGYFPSYTITTSDSVGTLNTITITLTHISEQCFAYNNSSNLDNLINKDVRIMYTGVKPFYVNARYYPTSKCINNRQSAATMLQEITATGDKLNNYWVLEGHEQDFEGSGKNIVGTYTTTSYLAGYNIVVNDSSCANFGVCELIQRPDPIYYFDINTKSATAPIQSTCAWQIVNKPDWIDLSVTSGNPNTLYNLAISPNKKGNLSGTFAIVTGDNSYNVTVNYEPLSKWIIKPGEYICVGDNSYEVYYKYTTVDGIQWIKQNEIRTGNVIQTQDSRCMQYEPISDTERWVLEDNMFICEEDTSGGGETVNLDDCLVYNTNSSQSYVIVNGYKYKLDPDKDYIYIGKDFDLLKFYEAPSYSTDPLYNVGLTKLDFSHLDTSKLKTMNEMFKSCADLDEIIFGENFNTGNVVSMEQTFYGCSKLTKLDVSGFDTSKVTTMQGCFNSCSNLHSLDLDNWATTKLSTISDMFSYCYALKELKMCQFQSNYNINGSIFSGMTNTTLSTTKAFINYLKQNNILPTSFGFIECGSSPSAPRTNVLEYETGMDYDRNLNYVTVNGTRVALSGTSKQLAEEINSITFRFYRDSSNVAVANNLVTINMSDIDTGSVTDMSYMFQSLKNLTVLNADFDTSSATTMQGMFGECGIVNLNLSKFNTSNVTDMSGMFANSKNLRNLDVRNFDISNVSNFAQMFFNCGVSSITCTSAFRSWCQANKTAMGFTTFDNVSWTIIG